MSIETTQIKVSGLQVKVLRKEIKNLHLGVYPPEGLVRVAAPKALTNEAVRRAVISKLGWIKRQRARFKGQPRQSRREMVNGESHYYLGRRYRLRLVNNNADAPDVVLRNTSTMELHIPSRMTIKDRQQILLDWYRVRLKARLGPLVSKWEKRMKVSTTFWGVKRMKTKWGSCNTSRRRIWLNLELVKKPPHCLEYILVHELVHILERRHNDRFIGLMDKFLPRWRLYRDELNSFPLSHADWYY